MQLYLNPLLQIVELKDNFHLVLNTSKKNSLKVVNSIQLELIKQIGNGISLQDWALRTKQKEEILLQFLEIFEPLEIIKKENSFNKPVTYNEIVNIDFWIHTTDQCNFNCPYCYIDKSKNNKIDSRVLNRFKEKIIDTVKKENLKEVSLRFSGGEPFIQFKQIQNFVAEFKQDIEKLDCNANIGFLTNLSLLNDEIVDFILKENLYTSVSLDGYGEYHNNTRFFSNGEGTFSTVDKNITKLLNLGHKRIILMIVLSDQNLDGLPQLAHYIAEKNIPFRFSIVTGQEINNNKLEKSLLEVYNIFEDYIEKHDYAFSRNHHLDDLRFLSPSIRPCNAGYSSGGLYSNGNMYFCQQELGSNNPSGSVFNNHNNLIEIIQKNKERHTSLHEDCNNCPYVYICAGGCPIYRENGKSPHCALYKILIPVVFKLIGIERLHRLKKSMAEK
jgi:uncharacterized protein